MKTRLLLAVAVLANAHLSADEAYVESLKRSPWLTPEMCSSSSPDFFYEQRLRENPRKLDVDSEQGQDAFFEAYADNLATFTDQHYPLAAKIRKPLNDAFASIFDFISNANGHSGVAHYSTRLPGRVEWRIYSGCKNEFQSGAGHYSLDDIRTLGRIYLRAQGEPYGPRDRESLEKELEAGIRKLQKVETLLGKDAIYYFRAQIMGMFGEFQGE